MKELKHLNKYFRKYWFKLSLGILITIIARVFQLVMPSYVAKIIAVVEQYLAAEISPPAITGVYWNYRRSRAVVRFFYVPDASDDH